MYVTQRSHQYFPGRQGLAASTTGLHGVEDVKLASLDGETLQAWYSPARAGKATILYFQGNGGEISDRADRFASLSGTGLWRALPVLSRLWRKHRNAQRAGSGE